MTPIYQQLGGKLILEPDQLSTNRSTEEKDVR
jgi:hypothetical protein